MNDQTKWDRIYSQKTNALNDPAEVLVENAHLISANDRALDLACGMGQNSLWLARQGLVVDSWDVSEVALNKLRQACTPDLTIHTKQVDITAASLARNTYDLIVVVRYLNRSLSQAIIKALRPDGLIFFQTFTLEKETTGSPSNPDYLLQPNELLSMFAALRVLVFKDEGTRGNCSRGLRGEAYIVAKKSSGADGTLRAY
ncbi:MAG: hypothetical protein CMQ33_01275 [Gammaproteobacteria bacterium]|jgi:tellurite methyltransferase|nr:hypothetical protein [Gammaproteobacteria bacterium]